MRTSKRRLWSTLAGVAILSGVIAIPFAANAIVQSFADVPPTHPFFVEIESIKKAGITAGSNECAPPISPAYCPDSSVRRDAMAAFMERGFTRVDGGAGDAIANDTVVAGIAAATVEAGATGAGTNGYVLATVTGTAFSETNCPCVVAIGIFDNGAVAGATALLTTATDPGTFAYQAMIPIAGDTTHTYTLGAMTSDLVAGVESSHVYGEISSVYIPFNGDTTNTHTSAPTEMSFQEYFESDDTGVLARVLEMRDRFGS